MRQRYLSFFIYHLSFSLAFLLLVGCKDADDLSRLATSDIRPQASDIIHVGGISTDELVAQSAITRTGIDEETVIHTDAENISWLLKPLFHGLDITYGKEGKPRTHKHVAILKLLKKSGDAETADNIKYSTYTVTENNVETQKQLAEYSFLYRDADTDDQIAVGDPALWYDNGAHFFEGLHVPERIVSGATGYPTKLIEDQHDDATTSGAEGNYTLLEHYLGMPSNFTLNATVGRIKLPFRHRLARVLAYILIDPSMGTGVTLNGYMKDEKGDPMTYEDPSTTDIKFCNVNVLQGVTDSYDATTGHHTYTPVWKEEARKVIPHFVEERGSWDDSKNISYNNHHFIAIYDTKKKTYIYPTDAEWATLNAKFPTVTEYYEKTTEKTSDGAYERTVYGKVPVYDLIVQPTYTSLDNVMYDETGYNDDDTRQDLYVATNKIDFELTLSNGLNYSKRFVFDLDANYQTVVYLHISRERVDYNSSGSELWVQTRSYDDYYGVNNENGNNLSLAGSSWQRAYRNKEQNYDVTDGHQYLHDSEDEYAQYVTNAKWIEMLSEAYEGGLHHGDYFILDEDIYIPAAAFPNDFVFTGHLDGQDHKITLTSNNYTKVTHPVTYVPYVQNEAGTVTKYIELAPGFYYEVIDEQIKFYEKGVDENNQEIYTYISDIYSYEGTFAYSLVYADDPNNIPSGTVVVYADDDTAHQYPMVYKRYDFYMKDYSATVTETIPGRTPDYMFAGMNAKYETAQERNEHADWEANVHKERNWSVTDTNADNYWYWVPYKTDTDGWRAEIINTTVSNATAENAPNSATFFSPGADVTGHVYNCWEKGERMADRIPPIPEY